MVRYRWFPFDAVDWRNSHFIRSLSRAQTGAYLSLLVELWLEKQCSLPSDRMALKKLAQWDQKMALLEPVIAHLIPHPECPGRLTDERQYSEWKKAHHVSEVHRKAAYERWEQGKKKATPTRRLTPKMTDRTTTGFQSISDDVRTVTDKWFPPQDP